MTTQNQPTQAEIRAIIGRQRTCSKAGHLLDETNTWIDPQGYARCRECNRARSIRNARKSKDEGGVRYGVGNLSVKEAQTKRNNFKESDRLYDTEAAEESDRAFSLRYLVENINYQQIADENNLTINTVRKKIMRFAIHNNLPITLKEIRSVWGENRIRAVFPVEIDEQAASVI